MFPVLVIVALVFIVLLKSLRVVPNDRRLIVFRLGRLLGVRGPGLVFLVPFIDHAMPIDMGLQTLELKTQDIPVNDSAPAQITSVVHYRVADPAKAATQVADYKDAFATLVKTKQRTFCANRSLTELFGERATLQEGLLAEIARAAQPWGIEVADLVVQYIDISEDSKEGMKNLAEDERRRRAGN